MIPGKRFTLADGKDYVVPPLTFRQVRGLDESGVSRRLVDTTSPQDNTLAAFETIHAALVRNYPEVKLEDMEALLDLGLVEALMQALLGKMRLEDRVAEGKAPRQ